MTFMGKKWSPKHFIKVSQVLFQDSKLIIDTGKELTIKILVNQSRSKTGMQFVTNTDDVREWTK